MRTNLMARDFSLGALFRTAVDLKNFVQHLPARVGGIFDRRADNEFQVKVDAIDEAAAGGIAVAVSIW